jgi:hypothetical protein
MWVAAAVDRKVKSVFMPDPALGIGDFGINAIHHPVTPCKP